MKIGIIGYPQTGKKTIFRLLTGADVQNMDAEKLKAPLNGIVTVKDPRFDVVVSKYSPKKKTLAQIEVVLIPKVDKEYIESGDLFEHLGDADAICHIARAFTDDAVYHIEGSVNAERDVNSANAELILTDLMFIEKRLEKLDRDLKKKGGNEREKEKPLLLRFKGQLEKELPLRLLALTDEEKKMISGYSFLTIKPLLIVLNVGEDDIKKEMLSQSVMEKGRLHDIRFIQVSAKIEDELARLDSAKDREAFLKELGIEEPAIDRLTRALCEALGLISFFTAANNEVRAWTIRKGSTAPQAAGTIHSDMERGFIRAEVVKYEDLISLGNEGKVKEAGKLMIKGKDYVVCDGDILNVRFNV
ncbi:MAG: redox-regulated ATPase YchF [Candidatus Omnitrophica bacterium]|nr:redox-regulated ATPase YchF [Candidatus Omnitrophota bacterium]